MPPASPKLIVGLGNPGSVYRKTRHNVGARVVHALAETLSAKWKNRSALRADLAEANYEGVTLLLAIPHSYMNESGKPVKLLAGHFEINPREDLLIVMDDVTLPFGRLRLRKSGQDGGHRGLRSIEKELETQQYARLRIGIAPVSNVGAHCRAPLPLEEYVLTPFTKEEEKELKAIGERTLQSCKLWISCPIEKAMDWTNRRL